MKTENNDTCIEFGNMQIYPVKRAVYVDSVEVALTRMEFDVLCFLTSNPDIAFTKDQIYEAVSKDEYTDGSYTIRDIIYRIRAKLGIPYIHTLHGYGYKFSIES